MAVDGSGRPLFLLSRLAEHTQNLLRREDASVLITEPLEGTKPPLSVARVTLLGPCRAVPEPEIAAVRTLFIAAHADASSYVGFSDFAFYRLEPRALRFVGGFGRMSWVTVEDYAAAEPDPLADLAEGILDHMNGDHAEAVVAYARVLAKIADATGAKLTSVDRYGFVLEAETPSGPKVARLAFERPVATSDDVREAMIALVREARKPT